MDIYDLQPDRQVQLIAMIRHRQTKDGSLQSTQPASARDALLFWNAVHPRKASGEAGDLASLFGI